MIKIVLDLGVSRDLLQDHAGAGTSKTKTKTKNMFAVRSRP